MPRKKVYKKKSRKQIKEGINIFINTRPTGRRSYNRKPKTQQVSYMPYGFVNIQPSQPSYNVIEDLRSEVRKLKPLPVEPVKQIEYIQPAFQKEIKPIQYEPIIEPDDIILGSVKDITEETIKNEKLNEYNEKMKHLKYINKHEKNKKKYNVNTPLEELAKKHDEILQKNKLKNSEKKNINI